MNYVLITPARNEADFIETTIKSVCSQSILPRKWVIVSDGSTDQTDEIVSEYTKRYEFIKLIRKEAEKDRNFGAKVRAIIVGYKEVNNIDYEFIGNLDADVSFNAEYYRSVLDLFHQNPRLGIAGGFIYENNNGIFQSRQFNTERSVAGAVQLFRRKCHEDIGGYIPLPYGGEDTVAEVMARMYGWEVRAFPQLKIYHFRPTSSANGLWKGKYNHGLKDYSLGTHPVYEVLRCCSRISGKPILLGAFVIFAGFTWAYCKRDPRIIPNEFIRYLRKEQLQFMRSSITNLFKGYSAY